MNSSLQGPSAPDPTPRPGSFLQPTAGKSLHDRILETHQKWGGFLLESSNEFETFSDV